MRGGPSRISPRSSGLPLFRLILFPELARDEGRDRVEHVLRLRAGGLEGELRSGPGREGDEPHQRVTVHRLAVVADGEARVVLLDQLDELGRRARVQSLAVHDLLDSGDRAWRGVT